MHAEIQVPAGEPATVSVSEHGQRFARFAWGVLAYNVAVILWGAFVRATGSGAGCGSHWPLCNGEVIPRNPGLDTLIEYSHRLTSGLALIGVVILFVWAFRRFGKGHPARLGAALTLFFMLTEAGVGAGLVLFELVAENESVARALFMGVHLANTFLLLGALTLTAHWGGGGDRVRLRGQGTLLPLLVTGLVGMILVGVSGAIAALGDTLYPASSLAAGFAEELSPTSHFLVRLRVLHPFMAIAVSLYLFFVVRLRPGADVPRPALRLSHQMTLLLFLQLALGTLNVALLAPVWMQLIHLLLADVLWVVVVLLAAARLSSRMSREALL